MEWTLFCFDPWLTEICFHYSDVIIVAMASQITSLTIVYSTVYSGADTKNIKASLAFVLAIHRWPVNSPHKWPVARKNVSIWWCHHFHLCNDHQTYIIGSDYGLLPKAIIWTNEGIAYWYICIYIYTYIYIYTPPQKSFRSLVPVRITR